MSNKAWLAAFDLFMIISCPPDISGYLVKKSNFFEDLLRKDFTKNKGLAKTVTQAIMTMMTSSDKIDFRKVVYGVQTKNAFVNTARGLYKILESKFKHEFAKIDILGTTKAKLKGKIDKLQFSSLKTAMEECIDDNCDKLEETADSLENKHVIREVSNHPVHIINSEGNLNPTAFIPFCLIGVYGVKVTK